jgi:uncharacterized protein (TIGR02271 family)
MSYTVVGIFDSKTEARAAMSELVSNGFVEENIDISEGNFGDDTQNATAAASNTGAGDGVSNFFSNLFSDNETQANNYASVARDSEAILTVQADTQERANEVAQIFDRHGSVDIEDRSTQYQQNSSQTSTNAQSNLTTGAATTGTARTGEAVIPVIEEQLQVGKREVEGGGARIRSRIVEKPVEEHLRLRQERVIVNRRPVNREVTNADANNFQEGSFEITERGEEAVVSKQARVVEEVSIGKQVEERDQVVSDTVRRTEVDVEEINTNTIDTDTNARRAGN